MKIKITDKISNGHNALLIPVFEGRTKVDGIDLPLTILKNQGKFQGKLGTSYRLSRESNKGIQEIVLIGLGKKQGLTYRRVQDAIAKGFKVAKGVKVKSLSVLLDHLALTKGKNKLYLKAIGEALKLADYSFDTYKTDRKESVLKKVELVITESEKYRDLLEEANDVAEAVIEARVLVNHPANIITPQTLADRAETLGKESGFDVEVIGLKGIEALGMKAFLSVAKASTEKPKFIIMRYTGDVKSKERLGLVGKGLTYDSGGLSIKSTAGMAIMKCDMGGAAAVIGAMKLIADRGLKTNVTAVVAACENMIAGNSYKPGDIIDSMGGKSIYIGNTDAEGRLTLIDAMHYIVTKEKVDKVVDIATLTGAALHCTDDVATVAITNDEDFYKSVASGFDQSGDYVWQMPVYDEFKERIKHKEADLTNTAGKPGTITAGLFIGEFTGGLPWTHLDIAGTAWATKESGIQSKGGTGVGVRALYNLAKSYSHK